MLALLFRLFGEDFQPAPEGTRLAVVGVVLISASHEGLCLFDVRIVVADRLCLSRQTQLQESLGVTEPTSLECYRDPLAPDRRDLVTSGPIDFLKYGLRPGQPARPRRILCARFEASARDARTLPSLSLEGASLSHARRASA